MSCVRLCECNAPVRATRTRVRQAEDRVGLRRRRDDWRVSSVSLALLLFVLAFGLNSASAHRTTSNKSTKSAVPDDDICMHWIAFNKIFVRRSIILRSPGVMLCLHCDAKSHPPYFLNNCLLHQSIVVRFGMQHPEEMCYEYFYVHLALKL